MFRMNFFKKYNRYKNNFKNKFNNTFYFQQCNWSLDRPIHDLQGRLSSAKVGDTVVDSFVWRRWHFSRFVALGTTCYRDDWKRFDENYSFHVREYIKMPFDHLN